MVSAEAIGNNQDLLTEILIRVPTKPLLKFKSVSKQWLSLISDRQFCLSHTRHHHSQYPTPTALLRMKPNDSIPEFEMVPLKPHIIVPKVPSFDFLNAPRFRIMQSCNGLLLLLCISSDQTNLLKYMYHTASKKEYMYYICNPTTKQFKRLSPPSCEFGDALVSVCMAFDPLKSNHYKLICARLVMMKTDNNKFRIDMYSSETGSWSPLEIPFTAPTREKLSNPVFCNGAVHWYNEFGTSLYFDVDRECFNTMPRPNLVQQQYNVQYFGESRGHLHLIVTEWFFPLQFDVLEMAADYSGWFVRYNVNLDAVGIAFTDILYYGQQSNFSVLDVIRAQKEEESIVVVLVDNKAISFNVHDMTSKKLCDRNLLPPARGSSRYTCKWSNNFQYFESLTYFS